MPYPLNWTPESGSGSRSHTYEEIQPNQDNYMEMHRLPVPIPSGPVMESQTRGKFTTQKAVALLGLLCVLLLIICVVLGSTRYSSHTETDLEKELKKNISSLEKTVEKIQHQWLYFKNSMYWISRELKTWDESSHICENLSANLVIIDSKEEEEFVEHIASIMKQNSWLGLTDRASEGVWKWSNKLSLTTGYWSPGQPESKEGNEDCVSVYSGGWHANPCQQRLHYICEVSMSCRPITSIGPTYQWCPCACCQSWIIQ